MDFSGNEGRRWASVWLLLLSLGLIPGSAGAMPEYADGSFLSLSLAPAEWMPMNEALRSQEEARALLISDELARYEGSWAAALADPRPFRSDEEFSGRHHHRRVGGFGDGNWFNELHGDDRCDDGRCGITTSAVPEPKSSTLMLAGIVALFLAVTRSRRRMRLAIR